MNFVERFIVVSQWLGATPFRAGLLLSVVIVMNVVIG